MVVYYNTLLLILLLLQIHHTLPLENLQGSLNFRNSLYLNLVTTHIKDILFTFIYNINIVSYSLSCFSILFLLFSFLSFYFTCVYLSAIIVIVRVHSHASVYNSHSRRSVSSECGGGSGGVGV